jgi:hypothetical protein
LCWDIFFIFETLAPFLAAVEIQPDRIRMLEVIRGQKMPGSHPAAGDQ